MNRTDRTIPSRLSCQGSQQCWARAEPPGKARLYRIPAMRLEVLIAGTAAFAVRTRETKNSCQGNHQTTRGARLRRGALGELRRAASGELGRVPPAYGLRASDPTCARCRDTPVQPLAAQPAVRCCMLRWSTFGDILYCTLQADDCT